MHYKQTKLFNISTEKATTDKVANFLLEMREKRNTLRENFIRDCAESVDNFEAPITRNDISNFVSANIKKNGCEQQDTRSENSRRPFWTLICHFNARKSRFEKNSLLSDYARTNVNVPDG